MTASSGLTGALPDLNEIKANYDRLTAENAELTTANAELTEELAAANARTEDAQARATKLASAVDRSVDVERAPGEFFPLDVVTYRFLDVVTGDTLAGPAVVVRAGEGALVVAPVSPLHLTLPAEAVAALPYEDEDHEDEDA